MYQRYGFTLIELLVVVLIIGILAAVALPQYNRAVEKSRFVKCRVWAKRILDAEREFYLANGQWSYDFEELTLDIPAGSTIKFSPPIGQLTLPAGDKFSLNANNTSLQFIYKDTTFSMFLGSGRLNCFHYGDKIKKPFCMSLAEDPEACAKPAGGNCLVATL